MFVTITQPVRINTVYIAYHDQAGAIWTVAYANSQWAAFQVKDLPFGIPGSTGNLPLAAAMSSYGWMCQAIKSITHSEV